MSLTLQPHAASSLRPKLSRIWSIAPPWRTSPPPPLVQPVWEEAYQKVLNTIYSMDAMMAKADCTSSAGEVGCPLYLIFSIFALARPLAFSAQPHCS